MNFALFPRSDSSHHASSIRSPGYRRGTIFEIKSQSQEKAIVYSDMKRLQSLVKKSVASPQSSIPTSTMSILARVEV